MPIPHKSKGRTGGGLANILGNTHFASRPYPRIAASRGIDETNPPVPVDFPTIDEWDRAVEYVCNNRGIAALTDENILAEVRRYKYEGNKHVIPPLLGPPQPPRRNGMKWSSVPTRTHYENPTEYQRQRSLLKKHGRLLLA